MIKRFIWIIAAAAVLLVSSCAATGVKNSMEPETSPSPVAESSETYSEQETKSEQETVSLGTQKDAELTLLTVQAGAIIQTIASQMEQKAITPAPGKRQRQITSMTLRETTGNGHRNGAVPIM